MTATTEHHRAIMTCDYDRQICAVRSALVASRQTLQCGFVVDTFVEMFEMEIVEKTVTSLPTAGEYSIWATCMSMCRSNSQHDDSILNF